MMLKHEFVHYRMVGLHFFKIIFIDFSTTDNNWLTWHIKLTDIRYSNKN